MENKENVIPKVTVNDYRKKPFPTKPQKVMDYYSVSPETRRKMNDQPDEFKSFWFDPVVKDYFDTVSTIKNTNWSMRKFLLEAKQERMAQGEPVDKIESVLAEYEPEDYLIHAELKPKIQFNRSYPPVVDRVARQFKGAVVHRNDWDE